MGQDSSIKKQPKSKTPAAQGTPATAPKPPKDKTPTAQGKTPATAPKSTKSQATPETDKGKKKKGLLRKLFSSSKKGSTSVGPH